MKFFRQYVLDNNEIRPNVNEDIKQYLPKKKDSIQLIDAIYQLKNLPAFIDKESKRDIVLNDVKNIYLLEWTTVQGAGELPYLSNESIQKIINSDTLYINTKVFHVHDEKYIYAGTKLSSDAFNILINESYNEADIEPSIIRCLKIDKRKNIYPDKIELNKAFECYFNEIDRKICSISEININSEIDGYFRVYSDNLKKRRSYVEFVLEYLNTEVAASLQNFISSCVQINTQKNSLLKEIDKERSIAENTIALIRKLHVFKDDQILNEEFYKTLRKEDVIILSVGWD